MPKTPERVAREDLLDSLETGDLIRLNGRLRVVRDISRKNGRARSFTFSIQACSWTRRPFTVYGRTDLYHKPLVVVKKGYGCISDPLTARLQREIETNHRELTCCDVIGVIF